MSKNQFAETMQVPTFTLTAWLHNGYNNNRQQKKMELKPAALVELISVSNIPQYSA